MAGAVLQLHRGGKDPDPAERAERAKAAVEALDAVQEMMRPDGAFYDAVRAVAQGLTIEYRLAELDAVRAKRQPPAERPSRK